MGGWVDRWAGAGQYMGGSGSIHGREWVIKWADGSIDGRVGR